MGEGAQKQETAQTNLNCTVEQRDSQTMTSPIAKTFSVLRQGPRHNGIGLLGVSLFVHPLQHSLVHLNPVRLRCERS